jgi:hypothetical protein
VSTLATLEGVAVIGGVPLGIAGLMWQMLTRYRDKAEQERRELAERDGRKFSEGVRSRDDELRQLKYERDEARRDNEAKDREIANAKAEARHWQEAYIEVTRRRGT